MSQPSYRRVCTGWNYITLASVHEADDHLLYVQGVYLQTYRRFYYEDIEAATWRKTHLPTILLSVFAGLWLFPLGLMLALGAGVFSLMALIPSILALTRLAMVLSSGGYCVLRLQTAVQSTAIAAAPTVAKARKICGVIDRHLAAAPPHEDVPHS